jgi:membrane protein
LIKKIQKSQSISQQFAALGSLMYRSFVELKSNDPLRMAGATAFFATFALPPILIIIIQLLGLFVNPRKISSDLIDRLSHVLGNTSAQQIKITLEAFRSMGQNWYVTLIGFVFLMFVATTLFVVIKNSLEQIWNISVRTDAGVMFKLKNRLRSLIIISLAGILFSIGLFTEGIQVFLGNYVDDIWRGAGIFASRAVNELVFSIVVTIWFTVLFRFLTAGRPKWRLALAGGFFTAILFTAGKIVLRYMLVLSQIGTIYGASGSIVLIMLFVFYSALMFYYGGCFIKILSEVYDHPIRPVKEAFTFELTEIDKS